MNYLHQRQGRVVDRRALLRDVWGYDDPGGSNVTEALVRSLRRKLGDRASVIQTVRGIGYRLTEGA
jgi:two-component system alkaline phosphatase synthesis response regulator PhoP